ncbi:hypothetical protein OUY22_00155 [Nonomuraea sp. MCN248]|uniref:DUF5642 domain-containing protein n=1 Tax=Nonomuraea corallina TaxID=2989783 RepID=A0ABT4S3P9_9ACTN|nr:hypothetical protein [Nonomuraea corallina]MDA0631814.1 hypothetical protein [Nonomuraea corallina]
MTVIAGCASEKTAPQAPAASAQPSQPAPAEAAKLRSALLPVPKGMEVAYGPEIGTYGTLRFTKQSLDAIRESKLEHPECAGATQLDAARPEIAKAPAAVVKFTSARGVITQSVMALPPEAFPGPLPDQCDAYSAQVRGMEVVYRTRDLALPRQGDESRAYLTTASGGERQAQIGTVTIRRGGFVMSLMVVGQEVKRAGLLELSRLADQNLSKAAV